MPAGRADQSHEAAARRLMDFGPRLAPDDEQQRLQAVVANRNDQTASRRQLLIQRLRNLRCTGSDNDAVIWRPFRPAEGAVADVKLDVRVPHPRQPLRGRLRQARATARS